MSIKTIGSNVTSNSIGIEKKINKGAERLVFDILQATQYSTPISSTVRELATNALDAQREKEIAVDILTGNKSIEDYYIQRDDEQYKDSNFDKSYYDINYLDLENNDVELTYIENEGIGFCDEFSVKDYGVGVGGNRLIGMSELGYSTKRNTSENFGAFGLGSKVALSTGVDFYVVESAYNGKYVKFQCFPYKTVFMISKWESDGEIRLNNDNIAYYKNYSGKNYTKISFGVKRHNRYKFSEAVEDQLMYIPGLRFFYKEEDSSIREKYFFKTPIHTSSNIIVSDGGYYSKPHIVIVKSPEANTGINYGHIEFRELEMEQLFGAVGLKCPIRQSYIDSDRVEHVIQDGVEVTPSREKVIWNDKTKRYIEELIDKAHDEIADLIDTELQSETDFLEWTKKCSIIVNPTITGNNDESKSILLVGKLARFLSLEKITPRFSLNNSIVYKTLSSALPYYSVYKVNVRGVSLQLSDVFQWSLIDLNNFYVLDDRRSQVKDYYLLSQSENIDNAAIYILRENTSKLNGISDEVKRNALFIKARAEEQIVLDFIKKSKYYKSYDDVEIPEDFKPPINLEDVTKSFRDMSPAERRKLEGNSVIHTLREDARRTRTEIVLDKVEPKTSLLLSSQTPTYYCTKEDHQELVAAFYLFKVFSYKYEHNRWNWYQDNSYYWDKLPTRFQHFPDTKVIKRRLSNPDFRVQLIQVSEKTEELLDLNPNIKHISHLFWEDNGDGTLSLNPFLKLIITNQEVPRLKHWFDYIKDINPEFKDVAFVISAMNDYIDDVLIPNYHECTLWKNIVRFSKYKLKVLNDVNRDDLIAEKLRELFHLDIKDIDVFYDDILEINTFVKEFTETVSILLDNIYENSRETDTTEFINEMEAYLKVRGKLDMQIPACLPSAVAIIKDILKISNDD